jgi:hypothetical protein
MAAKMQPLCAEAGGILGETKFFQPSESAGKELMEAEKIRKSGHICMGKKGRDPHP